MHTWVYNTFELCNTYKGFKNQDLPPFMFIPFQLKGKATIFS